MIDALHVLVRSGPERDAFSAAIGCLEDDAGLVRALLRAAGRPGRERASVDDLVQLATVMRAVDAAAEGRIELDELRRGLAAHSVATSHFERLGPTRSLVRTAAELLADPARPAGPVTRQLRLIHTHLVDSMREQLTGSVDPGTASRPVTSADAWREQHRIDDPETVAELDALATEWVDEPAGGARRAVWARRWEAVPVVGMFGDDDVVAGNLGDVAARHGSPHVLQVKLIAPARYEARGTMVTIGDGRRRCYAFAATAEGARLAASGDRGRSLLTTPGIDLVVAEDLEHHLVAGQIELVERVLGTTALAARARFREQLDALAATSGDDPPERMTIAARSFGHGRTRRA